LTDTDLSGKVAVVTGASRGIGAATAILFARSGARVVCTARTTDASAGPAPGTIDETVRAIRAEGGEAIAVPCDLMQDAGVDALASRTLAEYGRIDVLVNNAGYLYRSSFADLSMKRWDLMLGINLRGAVLCTKAFLPRMIEQGSGAIINVSSGAAAPSAAMAEVDAILGTLSYTVAKTAVEKLTEGLALELKPSGISVNCLRVELLIAAEGAVEGNPDIDYSVAEPPEVAAEALLWLATRKLSFTGRTATIMDIRQWRALGLFD
jgi:NAD(P)-dependent dehydrogenase (short-subunit alcohol dehydrogenase family)